MPDSDEVSIYKGELTINGIINSVAVLKRAFPALPLTFYDILTDRLKANRFTDARFADAVIHVIDTCHYPTPTIADFLSYDKKIPVINSKPLDEIR